MLVVIGLAFTGACQTVPLASGGWAGGAMAGGGWAGGVLAGGALAGGVRHVAAPFQYRNGFLNCASG